MLVKALNSFAGLKISMYAGEQREISDKEVLSDLLNAKLVEEVKSKKETTAKPKKTTKKGDE